MRKKIGLILLIIVVSFGTVFAVPQKQAEAVAFGAAVPAGITIGAGGYALGALALGGVVGVVGYTEHQDAINAHAKGVWEGGTETAINSLNASIELAKNAGTGVVNLQGDFINFMEGKLDNISGQSYNVGRSQVFENTDFKMTRGSYKGQNLFTLGSVVSTSNVVVNGQKALSVDVQAGVTGIVMNYRISSGTSYTSHEKIVMLGEAGTTAWSNALGSAQGLEEVLKVANRHFSIYLSTAANPFDYDLYNNVRSKTQETWETMRDAGMVLPVDSALPLSSIDGSPLTYNADSDTYTGIDGGLYTGTPDWAFPQPKIRVANPDIPGSVPTTGVYVDTPVLTGNPAWDEVIVGNPAIPNTTTNVQTGVTVDNPDIAIAEPVPVPGGGGTPEDGDSCARLKFPIFSPLKEQFSTSFPFSIPWDIGRAINAAFAEIGDDKPEFELDLAFMGEQKTIKITMPKMFDDWKPFSDSLLLFIFDVMIMFGIYRFVKGAGS